MSNVIAGCFTKTKIVLFVVISESHSLLQCGKVSNVKSLIETLRKSSRCFLCLNRENVFKNCTLSCICQKCDGKHHTSICSKLKKNQEKDESSVKSTGRCSCRFSKRYLTSDCQGKDHANTI